jgi:hypothetical protein
MSKDLKSFNQSNLNNLLILKNFNTPSNVVWSKIQREIFKLSPMDIKNFKLKSKRYELPNYSYGRKPFGKKLLSRQRFKHWYQISEKQLKQVTVQKNTTSAEDLLWPFEQKLIANRLTKIPTSLGGSKNKVEFKLNTLKNLSFYGLTTYLNHVSKTLLYLGIKINSKAIYRDILSQQYINTLLLLRSADQQLFLATNISSGIEQNATLSNAHMQSEEDETLVQIKTPEELFMSMMQQLNSIEDSISKIYTIKLSSSTKIKSTQDLTYLKKLLKTHHVAGSLEIHKTMLNYFKILKILIKDSYNGESNQMSHCTPHVIEDVSCGGFSLEKKFLKLSADQKEICADILSQQKIK